MKDLSPFRWIAAGVFAVTAFRVSNAEAVEPNRLDRPEQVRQYQIWDFAVPAAGIPISTNPATAAVDAKVTTPSGRILTMPAFVYQDFSRTREPAPAGRNAPHPGREKLTPRGRPHWRVRFAGRETGKYDVDFFLRTDKDQARKFASTRFFVTAANKPAHGFLRVSRKIPGRFAFDSGRGYFALGHNVCWVKREPGTYAYDNYLARMNQAGENFTRVWLCTWGIGLDTKVPYAVDQADAWRLDHVLGQARKLGIMVKLCIDNFYDFQNHFSASPFSSDNGGPCATRGDFFTSPKAAEQYRARLRYLVARYSAFTSLMAWELWNEMDYALHPYDMGSRNSRTTFMTYDDLQEKLMIPWTINMARELERLDPFRHMVTTSLGLHSMWTDLWQKPEMAFAQYHSYIHYLDWQREKVELDTAAFVLQGQSQVSGFGKPAFLAEFGYMGEGEASSMNRFDPTGIALHNSLWAGLMSGAAGIPMHWWWDNYIDPKNLYYHYRALSAFVAGVDWNQRFTPMRVEVPALRVLALRGRRLVLLWLQNRENTWYERIRNKRKPQTLRNVVLALRDFPRGEYTIRWFDPYRGTEISTSRLDGSSGIVRLKPPAFDRDVAARLDLREIIVTSENHKQPVGGNQAHHP